jgi:hypothetical protein
VEINILVGRKFKIVKGLVINRKLKSLKLVVFLARDIIFGWFGS